MGRITRAPNSVTIPEKLSVEAKCREKTGEEHGVFEKIVEAKEALEDKKKDVRIEQKKKISKSLRK
ncbi:MAG: hypothetical protein ABH851_00505 [Methanobacteriota archaeon]